MFRMVKKTVLAILLTITMMTMVGAQDIEEIISGIQEIGGIMDVFKEMMATLYPPELHSVKIEPEEPTANDEVTVTAEIYNDFDKTDLETIEAYVVYSADGGKTWNEEEMDQKDDKTWVGKIPPQESGKEIMYYFKAKDSAGNVYLELPCKVSGWPIEKDKELSCMFDSALDDEPYDDDPKKVPDDLDLLGAKIGYDDEYIYINPILQAEASGGTTNPTNIHVYISLIVQSVSGNVMDLAKESYVAIYAPLAEVGNFEPCMTTYAKGTKAVTDTDSIECKIENKQLYFRLKRKFGDKKIGNSYKLVGGATGAALSLTMGPTSGTYYDYTHFTLINEVSRSYKVK